MKEGKNLQMFAKFRLIKPAEPETVVTEDQISYLSVGGFSFKIGGKSIPFDFDAGGTTEEGGIFSYESGYGPFFNDFSLSDVYDKEYEKLGINRADISAEFLAKVTEIEEFHVSCDINAIAEECSIGDNTSPENEFRIELLSVSFLDRERCTEYCVAVNVLERFNNPEENDKITREMVAAAYKRGDIVLIYSPHDDGVVCSIGDYWFYFGGEEAEGCTVEEYKATVPTEDIVNEIYAVLEDFWRCRETFGDEYLYYKFYLKERARRVHNDENPIGRVVIEFEVDKDQLNKTGLTADEVIQAVKVSDHDVIDGFEVYPTFENLNISLCDDYFLSNGKVVAREQVSETSISRLMEKVRELSENSLRFSSQDADTILADVMEEADFDVTGLAEAIFKIWEQTTDKKAVEEMFIALTNMQLEDFLEKCISKLTREGGAKT